MVLLPAEECCTGKDGGCIERPGWNVARQLSSKILEMGQNSAPTGLT